MSNEMFDDPTGITATGAVLGECAHDALGWVRQRLIPDMRPLPRQPPPMRPVARLLCRDMVCNRE